MSLLTRENVVSTGSSTIWRWVFLSALHIPLALAMYFSSLVATAHALGTILIAGFIGLTTREPRKAAWAAAYIVGAEVLWRMTDARVFYEIGKYAVIAVLGICLLRQPKPKNIGLPLLYFLLFLPSVPLTLAGMDLNAARQYISFNLSGPLCLAVSVMFFSQIALRLEDRKTLAWLLAAPLVGMGAVIAYSIVTAEEIVFTNESNFITSAGFGPNQVSAVLGLGALMLVMLAIQDRKSRWPALVVGLGLLTLSVLTFSRGGLYNVAAGLLSSATVFLRDPRRRMSFLGIAVVGLLVSGFWIYPRLNNFTGGMITNRFADTNTTNRMEIMQAEFDIWLQNPILGTGPGMGKFGRYEELGFMTAAHTEYTRMVAEHGIFGLLALVLLLAMGLRAVRTALPGLPQAWAVAMLAWPLMEMTHAAMRIAAIGFIFGLAMVGHAEVQRDDQKDTRAVAR